MWLLELLWVITIILLLGFTLHVNDKQIHTIRFKHDLMLFHSYLAQNRLYNRYDTKHFEFDDNKHYALYKIVTKNNNLTYSTYDIHEFPHKELTLNLQFYRGFTRKNTMDTYSPGSIYFEYNVPNSTPLHTSFTINRVGGLRLTNKKWGTS